MLFAFILATSLTAISDKRKSMGGIPRATSRASLLEVIGALRQRAKAFCLVFIVILSYVRLLSVMQYIHILKQVERDQYKAG